MDQFRPSDDDYSVKDFQKGMDDATRALNRYLKGGGLWIVLGVVILLYVLSGMYKVGPGERGVALLFGKVFSITNPGLRYRLPRPFMSHIVVDVDKIRRAEVGFRADSGRTRSVPQESLMLTGDENIVDAQFFVQYKVNDPVKFLFGCREPEHALRVSAEVALRGVVGENTIEYTMTSGRLDVQQQVAKYLQNLLNTYNTGLEVIQARLLAVDPPAQVKEAFHDVVRAWEDKERLIREAEGYREDMLPKARGKAKQAISQAEAYKQQRVIRAKGDAERFDKVLLEYKKAPNVTRERLYLEAAEKFLPNTRKFIMDRGANALPILPLVQGPGGLNSGPKSNDETGSAASKKGE